MIVRLAIALLLLAAPALPIVAFGQDAPKVLKCGWYPWDPYQYLLVKQDVKRLTGLDVQLVRAVFAQMGYEVSYEEVSWKQHQRAADAYGRLSFKTQEPNVLNQKHKSKTWHRPSLQAGPRPA